MTIHELLTTTIDMEEIGGTLTYHVNEDESMIYIKNRWTGECYKATSTPEIAVGFIEGFARCWNIERELERGQR